MEAQSLKEGVWQRMTAKECVGVTSVELWVKEEREEKKKNVWVT
jgi:hypothetical protein